jgi:hypothetical protein
LRYLRLVKFTGTLSIPSLGFSIPVEVELVPETLPAAESETITEAALRARWKRSARTLKRLRDQGRLPYLQPTPRCFLYKLEDVRKHEAANYRGADRRAVRKPVPKAAHAHGIQS